MLNKSDQGLQMQLSQLQNANAQLELNHREQISKVHQYEIII